MPRNSYDMYRVDQRPFVYGPRDWRYSLRRVKVDRSVEPVLHDLSMMAANEISERAEENFMRTFYYNMMSERDFENDNFDRLIQFIADYVELRLVHREIRRPDDDLRRSVEEGVGMHMVKQLTDFRELEDELQRHGTDNQRRSVAQNLGRLQEVIRDIADMHERQDTGDYRRGDDRDRGRRDDRGGRGDYRSQYSDSRSGRGARDDYDRGRGRDRDDRYGRDSRDHYSRDRGEHLTGRELGERSTQPDFEPTPGQETRREYQRDDRRDTRPVDPDFEPIDTQPAQPAAAEPAVKATANVFQAIGGPIPILQPSKGQTEMDLHSHAAVYPNINTKGVDLTEVVAKTLSLSDALKAERPTPSQLSESVVQEPGLVLGTSIQDLARSVVNEAVQADIRDVGSDGEPVRRIHHRFGVVSNAVVGSARLTDLQTGLDRVKTMDDLSNALETAVIFTEQKASPDAAWASDIRATVEVIDRMITREINVYCREVLRISHADAIPSFMADYKDLLSATLNQDRPDCYDSLVSFSSQLSGNFAECLDPELGVGATVRGLVELDEKMGLSYFPLSYLVTYIPFTMRELGYEINSSVAIVPGEVTPFLYSALSTGSTDDGEDVTMSLRLVVSRDNKVFRLYRYHKHAAYILVPVQE